MKLLLVVTLLLAASAAAQTWKDLFSFPWSGAPMSIMLGIACPNATICYFSGSHGDDPYAVYYTTDTFKTVTEVNMKGNGFMLLSMAYSTSVNLVAAGIGLLKDSAFLYTKDGLDWMDSTELGLTVGQDVECIGPGEFAFVGGSLNLVNNINGVLYSKDQGDNWKEFPWATNLDIPEGVAARYGGFPTSDIWYVSGGSFPEHGGSSSGGPAPSTEEEGEIVLTHTFTINKRTKKFRRTMPGAKLNLDQSSSSTGNGYYAVMTKTTDGGKTWVNQYHNQNNFYFNDVCCASATVCMAAAEGFVDGDSPAGRIFGTTDGNTWTEIYNNTAAGAGMMMCHMLSTTEAWVAGSIDGGTKSEAILYHTVDGGKTWTQAAFEKGVGVVIGWSWTSSTRAFATAVTELSDSTILEFS